MRQQLTAILLSFLFIFLFPIQALAQDETYILDPDHSYVAWHINHFGFSTQEGKWFANGTLTLNKEKPEESKVNVTIDVGKFITGIDALNKHLAGKVFFDVAKYPIATFVSNKVVRTGKDTGKVTGILTLHGVAKPITLNVKFNKEGISPINNKPTVGFSAEATLKRSDFGMDTLIPGLGNKVRLTIQVEATKR